MLCGLSTGCEINPPPHPWRGNGVYNSNGKRQRVAVRMEDGEGVRFWLRIETDGTDADTIRVRGCRGTPRFVINAVLVGKHKRPNWRARNITGVQERHGDVRSPRAVGEEVPHPQHRGAYHG